MWLGLHWPNSKFTIGNIARSFRPNKNLHFVQVKASPSHKRRIVYHYIVYIHTYYSGYGVYIYNMYFLSLYISMCVYTFVYICLIILDDFR